MSTRDISWGVKAAGAYGLQPYNLRVPIVKKFWEPQTPGTLRAHSGPYMDYFTVLWTITVTTVLNV